MGGAEIYNLNLIKGVKKYYPEIELFFVTNLPEFTRKIEASGGKVFVLPVFSEEVGTKRGLGRLIFNLPKYLFYFLKEILFLRIEKGVKLAVFQGATEKIVLTPLLRLLKFKVIWLEHGPMFALKRTKIVLWLYKVGSRLVDKIVTVSEDAREDLIRGGVKKDKLVCLYTGIDTDYFRPLPPLEGKNLVVGFLGEICKEKGVDEFIKVGEVIQRKLKKVKFVLVGKGEARKKKNFIFTGFKEDVRPYLGKFSVFFFPTRHWEGLSLSILEAMEMGVPVVARDIGGNRELVVHGKTGYLFKDETPEELADIIIDLLKDKKKREAMGKAARERIVKYFNEKRWVTRVRKVFKEVARK